MKILIAVYLYIFSHFLIRQLVAWFIFTIVLSVFLNSIVGQVNHFVCLFVAEWFWRRADVSLFKPVSLDPFVDEDQQGITTDVKFPLAIQVRSDIALDDVCVFWRDSVQMWLNVGSRFMDSDAISSIGVFSRFDDPQILLFGKGWRVLSKCLELFVVCAVNVISDWNELKWILINARIVLA